ncbi:hypothetical protein L198_06438 [Cryptococcus wingfieldii CBS 7118]|uniref:Uncharacterized protein n=1 Tax=Cryptococcus wingfieldii CBS 7118 TaxID=1295528 RepID=A0A1E3IMB6_9TREE|nr:hypothetical protein L198_06438 [Cryptococcus wingfieldii CBS 7118]ODN89744.1 hypothetical protein L198_06438 [Cryptococcus wingfieldii CBS 7118]
MSLITLDRLPSEVRSLIFECLQKTTHKPTLSSLMRVSRAMYAKSMPRLYERVRLNASNAEAYFGRLTADGLDAIDEEIALHKPHLIDYIWQLERENFELPPWASQFIPPPIARKICQIWSTQHLFLEDAPAAIFLQQAATSLEYLYGQLYDNTDGLVDDRDECMEWISASVLSDDASVALGEPLAKSLILYPKVWEGVAKMLKGNYFMDSLDSICLRIPANCSGTAVAQYCKDMSSRYIGTFCVHNVNPLEHMSLEVLHENLHIFLRPEGSPGMLSHEASIGAFMSNLLNIGKKSRSLVPNIHFYNSQYTDVDRVSHQSRGFWNELEEASNVPPDVSGFKFYWPVTLKLYGPEEEVACPNCLETV